MTIDYTRNEIDVLIDLIRDDNSRRTLTTGQVTFGSPNVFTPIPGVNRNTLVIATAIADRGYSGSQTFYYNRVPLQAFVPDDQVDALTFNQGDGTKLSDLLTEINSRFNIKLTHDTIVDKAIPSFENTPYANILLEVTPNSLVYLGSLVIKVVPDEIPLTAIVTTVNLDGLTYASP